MSKESMLRPHRRRLLYYGLLMLAVMLFIFYMSGKSGSDSSNMSSRFFNSAFGRFLVRILPKLTDDEHTSIRKYAHIFEFFCLGICSFLFFFELFWKRRLRLPETVFTALIWSVLYACSDEWHQTFVPERAGRFSDLRFDTAGILIGIALMCAAAWIRKRKKEESSPAE